MLWINVAISLSTFVIIEIIRKSPIYRIFGLSSPVTPGEAISDKRKFVIFPLHQMALHFCSFDYHRDPTFLHNRRFIYLRILQIS
jgi:hypothetical protein